DVIVSAFGSAGQRCSALRILYLPEDSADELIEGLIGALATQRVGDPADPATDIGPVIDADSRKVLEDHVRRLEKEAKVLARAILADSANAGAGSGDYFAPTIAEIPTPD